MHPVVATLRLGEHDVAIGGYGLMLALAIFVGSAIAVRAAHRAKMDTPAVLAICGMVTAGSLAGAASLFAIVELLTTGSLAGLVERGPGLVFLGAPIGGGLALVAGARALGVPLGRLVDVAIPAVPAAHAIGRLGCFLGGCCFGAPYDGPLSVVYSDPRADAAHPAVPRHPWPLYEAAAMLVLAFVFACAPPSRVGDGTRGLVYCAVYGACRVALEPLRGDAVRGVFAGGISTSQILGAAMCALGIVGFLRLRESKLA